MKYIEKIHLETWKQGDELGYSRIIGGLYNILRHQLYHTVTGQFYCTCIFYPTNT